MRDFLMSGAKGRLNILPFKEEYFGSEWYAKIISENIDFESEYNKFDNLKNIDFDKIQQSFDKTIAKGFMNNLCSKKNKVGLRRKGMCKYPQTEIDTLGGLQMTFYFSIVCFFLMNECDKFPTCSKYWEFWQQIHAPDMEKNLYHDDSQSIMYIATSTVDTWIMFDQQTLLSKAKGEFRDKAIEQCKLMSPQIYKDKVMIGTEFRCRQFYASWIRELHLISNLIERMPDCIFWYSPYMDIFGKIDVIIVIPKYNRIVGLCIYLKTPMSIEQIKRKNDDMPKDAIKLLDYTIGVPVAEDEVAKENDTVILMSEDKITELVDSLMSDEKEFRKKHFSKLYFQENPNRSK